MEGGRVVVGEGVVLAFSVVLGLVVLSGESSLVVDFGVDSTPNTGEKE